MTTAHTAAQTTAFDGAHCRVYALAPSNLAFYNPDNGDAWISTSEAVDTREIR
jgi:hypothetical protein